ncbi:hypothetical protein HYC85_014103 [Camellia sinensis]|uniref:Uncharacterized protein n=1 Tax=Camellia sinensis TaxID=4442 RepID=A0A7J7H8N1_CAMSI|nr:hypothetical protein HYC85_014103 [Camellia sinensis]
MGDNLFQGLPPPSAPPPPPRPSVEQQSSKITTAAAKESLPKLPIPALKSALKRSKPSESQPQVTVPEKRLRFKTTTDASETQVIEAMQKISSHIKNPAKFGKASKLAIQLIQAGSVKPGVSDYFFAILESAMLSPTACNNASVRADCHALFSAAQDAVECFNKKQRNQLTTWMIRAVVANDLFTDDSFVFSKATGRIKEAILNLPVATKDEDMEEAAALQDKMEVAEVDSQIKPDASTSEGNDKDDSDPFGLDALIPRTLKKDEKMKGNKEATTRIKEEEEETKRFLKSQREALILCLDIAARRSLLNKEMLSGNFGHPYGNSRLGGSKASPVSGKLDVNGFEWLQQKYANEKISIRHSVGGSGDRRAQQWLG